MISHTSERGSIPLVLLVAIVLAGLIVALYIDVSTGMRLASNDRDFNQAVQVADAGIQEAFTYLAALPEEDRPEIGDWLFAAGSEPAGTLARGTYTWNAVRIGQNQWEVRAEGRVGDIERVLESRMGPLTLFSMAAFGDEVLNLRGANAASSYPAGGRGYVASNGLVRLDGNARVDGVTLHGGASYDGRDTNIRGDGLPGFAPEQVLPNLGLEAFGELGACDGVTPSPNLELPLIEGRTYCVAQADFPGGEAHLIEPATQAEKDAVVAAGLEWDPTVHIYVAVGGDLHVQGQGANAATVNMTRDQANPDASRLMILLAGGSVKLNNHTQIAAGIYGSASSCSEASNAQAEIYGSIVCRDLVNQGGWQFHYDERLSDVNIDYFSIRGLREEPGGTTSIVSSE